MMKNKNITICACASRAFIDKKKVAETTVLLKMRGYDVTLIPDLCRKVMQKDNDVKEIAAGVVIACHSRAVRSHFDWLGLYADRLLNLRENSPEEVFSQLSGLSTLQVNAETSSASEDTQHSGLQETTNVSEGTTPKPCGEAEFSDIVETDETINRLPTIEAYLEEIRQFPIENGTDAWYPVIDKERCVECGKCHDFCLFGVYTVENKTVRVTQPQNCKNNCPACARMCPSNAIIFPKYEKSPINGGMAIEETYSSEEMDQMYREKLKMKLQQRRASVSLLKETKLQDANHKEQQHQETKLQEQPLRSTMENDWEQKNSPLLLEKKPTNESL